MPSASRYSRERGVYGSSQSEMWSISLRFFSSGTRQSKQRLPASMWKIGTSWRAAAIGRQAAVRVAEDQQRVGLEREQLASLREMISPICAPTVSARIPR